MSDDSSDLTQDDDAKKEESERVKRGFGFELFKVVKVWRNYEGPSPVEKETPDPVPMKPVKGGWREVLERINVALQHIVVRQFERYVPPQIEEFDDRDTQAIDVANEPLDFIESEQAELCRDAVDAELAKQIEAVGETEPPLSDSERDAEIEARLAALIDFINKRAEQGVIIELREASPGSWKLFIVREEDDRAIERLDDELDRLLEDWPEDDDSPDDET